jgi:CRISPR-associated exonuclease Cas4
MEYREDEWLQLAGLQHFAFCRRQWALIHIEQLWAENLRTVEGDLLHRKAHDNADRESRGDVYILRGVSIQSRTLGVSGQCDVIEFHRCEYGIPLQAKEGLWKPYPVEYKRGRPKENDADRLQLCVQAMCLEEMLSCEIPQGALFYGETRRREEVDFTEELRKLVRDYLAEMHNCFKRGYTPKVKPFKGCNACSLAELCLPKMSRRQCVSEYIANAMADAPDTPDGTRER